MMTGRTRYGKVGVLAGGPSSEREISLRSGKAVHNALVREGIDAVLLDVTGDLAGRLASNPVDVAFIALHGRYGEDGTVQKMLDRMRIPYTGSGAESSSVAIDKAASKEAFIKSGLPVPRYVVFEQARSGLFSEKPDHPVPLAQDRFRIEDACRLGFPVVVKPCLEGSSIGLSVVRQKGDLAAAVDTAFTYGSKVLIEEYIDGRELTVGLLDDEPLPVIEIVTREKIYDYKAKYSDPETRYLVPAPLDAEIFKRAQDLALRSHRALGCRCFSRIDMMMDPKGGLFVLEANTVPGMTERSLLPKAAQAAGLSFGQLCVKLIADALERWK